jgi:hypothetical protein
LERKGNFEIPVEESSSEVGKIKDNFNPSSREE